MTKTEKFWNLVDGMVFNRNWSFPVEAYFGDLKDQRKALLVMQYIPNSFFEEARKRRLEVFVWSNAQFPELGDPWSFVLVWITPDILRWR